MWPPPTTPWCAGRSVTRRSCRREITPTVWTGRGCSTCGGWRGPAWVRSSDGTCAEDEEEWHRFLQAFNAWAFERGGIPLLNQSPFVTREQVVAAYGDRWQRLSDWIQKVDPAGRMRNQYFDDLLVS